MFYPQFYKNILTIPSDDLQDAAQGGLIIALASSIYYFMFGGILGMSGMAGSVVKFPTRTATKAKALVILGVVSASAALNALHQHKQLRQLPFDSQQSTQATPIVTLVLSGLLVGIGTQLSNGCTSGHGLCGLPRFSLRSFTAVIVFLSTAICSATFDIFKGLSDPKWLSIPSLQTLEISPTILVSASMFLFLLLVLLDKQHSFVAKIVLYIIGAVFGCGLMIAGMSYRSKIYGFLQLDKNWDPSLLFVLMTGVAVNLVTFNLIRKFIKKPTYGQKIEDPQGKVTFRLILGALLFGLGWGLGGLCPGPYLLSIPNSLKIAVYWGLPFFLSQKTTSAVFAEGTKAVHVKSV